MQGVIDDRAGCRHEPGTRRGVFFLGVYLCLRASWVRSAGVGVNRMDGIVWTYLGDSELL